MDKILPKGVSREAFDAAIAEFSGVIGREWVFVEEDAKLHSFNDHYPLQDPTLHAPSAAIAPKGLEQIQKVLAIARNYKIPLWTVSTGRNLIYGGSAPCMAGCVVVSLKRMNRILEVNEKHAYAVVEPGVSYFDLYNHLQKTGSKLWIDCAAPGWGGVVGNTMDRGVGYTPYGEHFMMQCGMQVVLADGTVIDTAMGSQAGSATGHIYRYGRGPWMDGIFTMANYGIATKLGIYLMPEPPGYRPYMITIPREQDVEPFTDLLRPLKLNLLIPNAAVTVDLILEAAILVTKAQYYTGQGPMPDSARNKMMEDLHLGMWNFYGALYGPEKIMDNNWKIIKEAFSQIKGTRFYFEEDRGHDASFAYRAKLMRGIPNMSEFSYVNWIPNGGHVAFAPMAAVNGKTALEQYLLVKNRANEYGFDYLGEYIVGWRDMHHVFVPVYNRGDEQERQRLYELLNLLIDEAAAAGYGEYRTHIDLMDRIAGTYNWNNNALLNFNHRVKDILDPDGILSPGKSGIWPAGLRETGS